jgi:hypothetical protein
MVSFGPGGAAGVAVTVAMVAVAIVEVEGVEEGVKQVGVAVASFIQIFVLFCRFVLEFLGQLCAMWPWTLHLKHRPSALYCACSSSVSLFNGSVVLAASTP